MIVTLAQPVQHGELSHALAASKKPDDYSRERVTTASLIEELWSDLVIFDKSTKNTADDPVPRFAHMSIPDFFLQSAEAAGATPNLSMYFTRAALANQEPGTTCLN